jgi:type IV pilus assembly protein PilC
VTTFAYRAQTSDARVVRGVLAAADAPAALAQMERLRLRPIELRPYRESPWRRLAARLRRGAPEGEKLLLLRQLQTMLGSGIPLVRALGALAGQMEHERVRRMVTAIRADVEHGATMAEACAHQPALFSPLQVQMVRAAEQSGLLEEMLDRMADLHEKEMEIKRNVRSALFYPGLVVGELTLAIGIILKFVFPRFVQIFAGFRAQLPLPTVVLIRLSYLFDHYGWLLPPLLVAAFAAWRVARRRPAFRLWSDGALLRVPLLGSVFQRIYLSRFSHLLANLVDAGIPLVAALRLGADTLGNAWLKRDAVALRERVEHGASIA